MDLQRSLEAQEKELRKLRQSKEFNEELKRFIALQKPGKLHNISLQLRLYGVVLKRTPLRQLINCSAEA